MRTFYEKPFLHRFFYQITPDFLLHLRKLFFRQRTIQNTPIHAVPNVAHEKLVFSKLLGFIAWRFHIVHIHKNFTVFPPRERYFLGGNG